MTAAILIALRTLQPLATNTITAPAGTPRARAGIGDMAWFAGHWTGTGLGGQTEETWSAPAGDAMMGMFRLVRDGRWCSTRPAELRFDGITFRRVAPDRVEIFLAIRNRQDGSVREEVFPLIRTPVSD